MERVYDDADTGRFVWRGEVEGLLERRHHRSVCGVHRMQRLDRELHAVRRGVRCEDLERVRDLLSCPNEVAGAGREATGDEDDDGA